MVSECLMSVDLRKLEVVVGAEIDEVDRERERGEIWDD